MRLDPTLSSLAAQQHGLLTRQQVEAQGFNRWTWRSLTDDGVLVPVDESLARLVGAPDSTEQRIMAGVLGTGVESVASHASAAYLWGGFHTLPDGPVDVLTRRESTGFRQRDDCRVHRPKDWLDVGNAHQRGIRVTNPVRTLIDLGATAPGLVGFAVERMVINGVVTRSGLARGVARHGRRGRHGIGRLRSVLADWSFGDEVPDSVLEVRFASLLVKHGLPPAVFHFDVQGFILDAAWPEYQVGAEVDGWDKYTQKEQFQRQMQRDALLGAIGWRLPHFMWQDVVRRDRYVASVLRRTLREAGYRPS